MASLNKVEIIGNLGRDPETKQGSGWTVCNFSVATTEKWKDKQSGEWKEKTEWHNIVAWGKLAEICGQYLHKGKQIYVSGKLQTDQWEQDGVKRSATKIVASEMLMLGNKSYTDSGYQPPPQRPQTTAPAYMQPAPEPDFNNQQPGPGPSADDDLPF